MKRQWNGSQVLNGVNTRTTHTHRGVGARGGGGWPAGSDDDDDDDDGGYEYKSQ